MADNSQKNTDELDAVATINAEIAEGRRIAKELSQVQEESQPSTFDEELEAFGLTQEQAQDRIEQMQSKAMGGMNPLSAAGITKETPINDSPLVIEERFGLNFADEKGRKAFLDGRFQEWEDTKEGTVVKQDDLWYNMDEKGGPADPWELTKAVMKTSTAAAGAFLQAPTIIAESLISAAQGKGAESRALKPYLKFLNSDKVTKELVSDLADMSKDTALIGTAVGVGVVTGGASLAVQIGALALAGGGTSLAVTSFGKLQGTYQGEWDQQLEEASMEALLNTAGVLIPAAGGKLIRAKKTQQMAKYMMDTLRPASNFFKEAGKAAARTGSNAIQVIADIAGAGSKVGTDKTFRLWNRFDKIDNVIRKAIGKGGRDAEVAAKLSGRSVSTMMGIGKLSRRALTKMYGEMADRIVNTTPDNVIINSAKPFADSMDDLIRRGMAVKNKVGRTVELTAKEMKSMLPPPGTAVDQLRIAIESDPKAYGLFRKIFKNAEVAAQSKERVGKKAIRSLLDGEKDLIQSLAAFKEDALRLESSTSSSALVKYIDDLQIQIDLNVRTQIEASIGKSNTTTLSNEILDLRSKYAMTKANVEDMMKLNSASKAQGRLAQGAVRTKALKEVNNLVAEAGEKELKGESLRKGLDVLNQYDPRIGKRVDHILDLDTAQAMIPQVRTTFVQFGAVVATGAAGGALFTGDAKGAIVGGLGLGALVASTSPRAFLNILRASKGTSRAIERIGQATNQAMFKLRHMMSGLTDEQRIELMSRPGAMEGLVQGLMRVPQQLAQTELELEQALQQQQQGAGGQ